MVDVTKYTFSQGVQTNADDLVAAPRTVVVVDVVETGDLKQPLAVRYEGDGGKPFIPCLTMRKLIAALWGGESDNWIGKSMTLFRDPSIKFGPDTPGGVRISHMSDIEKTVSVQLLEKRGKRRQYTIVPLDVVKPAKVEVVADNSSVATQDEARSVARQGRDAFTVWWKAASKEQKHAANEIMEELKKLMADAE